jgi:hypothetical protein
MLRACGTGVFWPSGEIVLAKRTGWRSSARPGAGLEACWLGFEDCHSECHLTLLTRVWSNFQTRAKFCLSVAILRKVVVHPLPLFSGDDPRRLPPCPGHQSGRPRFRGGAGLGILQRNPFKEISFRIGEGWTVPDDGPEKPPFLRSAITLLLFWRRRLPRWPLLPNRLPTRHTIQGRYSLTRRAS